MGQVEKSVVQTFVASAVKTIFVFMEKTRNIKQRCFSLYSFIALPLICKLCLVCCAIRRVGISGIESM